MRTSPNIKVTSTKLRIGAALLAIIAIPAPATGQQKAVSIWAGGPILTMNDQAMRAEAVALAGGKSLAAGKRSEVMKLKDPTTQLFDLKWAQANTAAIGKTGFIVAMGYDNAQPKELRHPTKEELDAGTKNPPGGVVQRKPGTGEPNGVLDATVTRRARGSGRIVGATQRFDVITASTTIADTKVTETVNEGEAILKLDPSVKTAHAPTDITPLLAAFGGHRGGVDDGCVHDAMFRMTAPMATGQAGR